jgi:hypothetical protein
MVFGARNCWVLLVLTLFSMPGYSQSGKIETAVLSWAGHGQVFQIGINKQEFMGVLEGVLYLDSAAGALDDAFMECTVKQQLDLQSKTTSAQGNCVITQSPEDNIFAQYQCEGAIGACTGKLQLTSGTGKFENISGASDIVVRSPMRHLASSLTDMEDLVVPNGIVLFTNLAYKL